MTNVQADKDNEHDRAKATRLLALFEDIRTEIALLDELDLTDVHPAVIFNPLGGAEEQRD